MTCPICNSKLYENSRLETTTGTFISVKCANPGCSFFDYKTLPISLSGTISEMQEYDSLEKNMTARRKI